MVRELSEAAGMGSVFPKMQYQRFGNTRVKKMNPKSRKVKIGNIGEGKQGEEAQGYSFKCKSNCWFAIVVASKIKH